MYFILEDTHGHFYTESLANEEFPSLQAAEKKLQALRELKPKGKYFIVTRVQAWQWFWDLIGYIYERYIYERRIGLRLFTRSINRAT